MYDGKNISTGDQYYPFKAVEFVTNQNEFKSPFTCYDEYFCGTVLSSKIRHYILGCIGLPLLVTCFILNVLISSVLGNRALRSTTNTYLSAALMTDTIRLCLQICLTVVTSLKGDLHYQLKVYQHFVAYIIPTSLPFRQISEVFLTLCFMSTVCIQITSVRRRILGNDNSLPCRSSSTMCHASRRMCIVTILFVSVIVSFPSFFRYKLVEVGSDISGATIKSTAWNTVTYQWYEVICLILLWTLLFILTITLQVYHIYNAGSRISTVSENVIDRRLMESMLVVPLAWLWIVPSFYILTLRTINVSGMLKSQQETYAYLLVGYECLDCFFTMSRTLTYLSHGVYLRRMLYRMFQLWLCPQRMAYLNNVSTSKLFLSSGILFCGDNLTERCKCSHKLSRTSQYLPLMLSKGSFLKMEGKAVETDSQTPHTDEDVQIECSASRPNLRKSEKRCIPDKCLSTNV